MTASQSVTTGTLAGTVSGTALAVGANISSPDILKTVILATIGAAVSFGVSLLLKWITRDKG